MAIDILSAGASGLHTFKRVNVNTEDNYIYFKDTNIPSSIVNGSSYIYNDGTGSIDGLANNTLGYAKHETSQILKLVNEDDEDLDFTGVVPGGISLNIPVVYDGVLQIGASTASNQAVKYYTSGTPLNEA
jgi:hypothetical protein